MGITETVESDEHKFAIWFRKHNTSDIYVCGVESLESKQSWIKILKDLISVYGFLRSPGGSRSGKEIVVLRLSFLTR